MNGQFTIVKQRHVAPEQLEAQLRLRRPDQLAVERHHRQPRRQPLHRRPRPRGTRPSPPAGRSSSASPPARAASPPGEPGADPTGHNQPPASHAPMARPTASHRGTAGADRCPGQRHGRRRRHAHGLRRRHRRPTAPSSSTRTTRSPTPPAAGFVGTDTFTYTVSDGKGGTATPATSPFLVTAAGRRLDLAGPGFRPLCRCHALPDLRLRDRRPGRRGSSSSPWRSSPPTRRTSRPGAGSTPTTSPAPTSTSDCKTQITALRALGGDVAVSFGGASGQDLAEVITDVNDPDRRLPLGDPGLRADPHRLRHRGGARWPTTRRSTAARRRSPRWSRRPGPPAAS